ncbi:hypothetical protein QBC40DRAFT_67010 [Triangularia verruculosa]|uniref:Uncharacterized protein n=1 Tax=Triangularia verruculosa TaxID=2587418 RepID=A0AAN7AVQ4_9PEZI|nr:hypothetical protein QBC40DRAFT_67010 [Triangularia verruculosa]
MFLHSGASLHGHEYSNRPSPSTPPAATHNLRSPLLRSAFAPPKQRVNVDGASAPILRQRPASDFIPRALSPVVRFREDPEDDAPPQTPAMPEPPSDSELSDATHSNAGTLATRSTPRRRRHRVQRKSTTYGLGYPMPKLLDKTKYVRKVLPRLLLQLQLVSEDGRSRPVLEVFPSSRIAGPVIAPRLAKRFPGIFGVKHSLAYDDIVLVRRDDDHQESDSTEGESDDALEKRKLVAVYSPLRHSDEAEIVLDDGTVWVARPLPNGSWDFVHTDDKGDTTTARWARRHKPAPTALSTEPGTPSSATTPQTRYTFSMINPLTRRHPVMASLTPSSLDIRDSYTSVSNPSSRYQPPRHGRGRSLSNVTCSTVPNSPSQQSSLCFSTDGESDSGLGMPVSLNQEMAEAPVHAVDEATKNLISVTALWVALSSGWSSAHTPTTSTPESAATTPSMATTRVGRNRRNTWGSRASNTSDAGQRSECADLVMGIAKRNSLPPQCLPEESDNDKRSATPTGTPVISRSSTPVSNMSTNPKAAPRRATSTGAAYMQRRLRASSTSEATVAEVAEMNAAKNSAVAETDTQAQPESSTTAPQPVSAGPGPIRPSLKPKGSNVHRNSSITIKVVSSPNRETHGVTVKRSRSLFSSSKRADKCKVTERDLGEGLNSPGKEKKKLKERFSRWMSKLGVSSSR